MEFSIMNNADFLREIMDIKFTVTSGYRCPIHNLKVGGAKNSFHLQGKALDFTVARKELLPLIYRVAIASGRFNGIGINTTKNYIHIDNGDRKTPFYYVYPPQGGRKQLCPEVLAKIQAETVEEHLLEYKV